MALSHPIDVTRAIAERSPSLEAGNTDAHVHQKLSRGSILAALIPPANSRNNQRFRHRICPHNYGENSLQQQKLMWRYLQKLARISYEVKKQDRTYTD